MSNKNLNEMSEEAFDTWFAGVHTTKDFSAPTEENLTMLFMEAMKSVTAEHRASALVALANMSLALADKTLGAQSVVAECIVLVKH